MGRVAERAQRRGVVVATLVCIVVVVAVQSLLHLEFALGGHRFDTVFDLDRSNGIPDIVSTLVLGSGAAGAAVLWRRSLGIVAAAPALLVAVLSLLTFADLLHDGAHPSRERGLLVILLACTTMMLLLVVAVCGGRGTRALVALASVALLGAFVVPGLDNYNRWFERERGDPVREYQIVAKENLELIGWSLVALGLWWEASRRRAPTRARAPASPGPAEPRRRAA